MRQLLKRPRPLRPLPRLKPPRPRKRRKPPLPRLMPPLLRKRRLPRPKRLRPLLPRKARPRLRKTRSLPTPRRRRPPCRPCPRAPNTARPSRRKPFRPSKRPSIDKKQGESLPRPSPFAFPVSLPGGNSTRQLRQRLPHLSAAGLPAAPHFGQRDCDSISISLPDDVSANIRKGCRPRWRISPKRHDTTPTNANVPDLSPYRTVKQGGHQSRPLFGRQLFFVWRFRPSPPLRL